jgi:hypothetical protein
MVKDITIPAYFLAATNDHYIPSDNSVLLSRQWGAPVQYTLFAGRHFRRRSDDIVTRPIDFLKFYCITANSTGDNSKMIAPHPPSPFVSSSSATAGSSGELTDDESLENLLPIGDLDNDYDDVFDPEVKEEY